MPNPYEQLFQREKKETKDYEPVEGEMECQVCYEIVTIGQYYANEKLLRYKCSRGHESKHYGVNL